MVIATKVIEFKCARWRLPDGTYQAEQVPQKYAGNHFGPELCQYIIYQHHFNRVTQNKIYQELKDKSIDISIGQIDAILAKAAINFAAEKETILATALPNSNFIQTDDTGARHQGQNGFSTVICNDIFTYFKTTSSKSRINFFKILNVNKQPYVVDDNAIMYAKNHTITENTMIWLESKKGSIYYESELENFFGNKILSKNEKRIVIEACLFAACINGGLSLDQILLSDGAKQFYVPKHALCWIHAERALKKIIPIDDKEKAEIDKIRNLIWQLYDELKEYCKFPSKEKKIYLLKKFDEIFSMPTYGDSIAPILGTFLKNKNKLLLILEHPEVPLHNNTAEQDIRDIVVKRKISGGTRSDLGRDARDIFTSLIKTCLKNNISFWEFLGDRTKKINIIPQLAQIISQRIFGHT